ncbi:hypothetical protein NFI96_015765 [Prochilodus magdalenae]|nr:hypothetical protein NFI96_015765 [Prochilodus magdalenae]
MVKRQVHMLEQQSQESSSTPQHDSSTHSVAQSVKRQLSNTPQHDSSTHPVSQPIKKRVHILEQQPQQAQELSSTSQDDSSTQPTFQSVKRQVHMLEQQSQESSSTPQHDSSTHPVAQSVKKPVCLVEQQPQPAQEPSSTPQDDSSTQPTFQSVKRQIHMLEQQSQESSSTPQHDSSAHPVAQSVKKPVCLVEQQPQQAQEPSSTPQDDSSTQPTFQLVKRQIHMLEQQSQESSSTPQHDSSTHPVAQSVKKPVCLVEQQPQLAQEPSSMPQDDSSTQPTLPSVKRQIHMLEQQSQESSSTPQHDSSTHPVAQSVKRQLSNTPQHDSSTSPVSQSIKKPVPMLEQQPAQEPSSTPQDDSSTQQTFPSVKLHIRLMEQKSELSNMVQCSSPTQPAPRPPMGHVPHPVVQQSQENSSTLQQGYPPGSTSQQLQTQLETYMSDTLTYIKTVKEFCDQEPRWTLQRELEIKKMKEIKNKVEQFFGGCKKKNQERELGETLKDTLEGLEKLQHFLDAVERLAVTSPLVFKDEVFLPRGMSAKDVRSVISTARMVSSLLIHFKRDDGAFFFPSLDNLDVLVFQLHKYMRVVQWLCKKMNFRELIFLIYSMWKNRKPLQFNMEKRESMIDVIVHLGQLSNIRMDKSFGLTYLFDEGAQDFIDKYTECCSEMFQFLLACLEGESRSLSWTKPGLWPPSHCRSVLNPHFSTGVGLGVTSGVNGLVTGGGHRKQSKETSNGKKGEYIFRNFMGDGQKVLGLSRAASTLE